MENMNERNEELYDELREKFNERFSDDGRDAYADWWYTYVGEIFEEKEDAFMYELAEIIAKHMGPDVSIDGAYILVNCELNSIKTYANRIQDRMYDIELANYARDKFLNDLIDAVINEFGEI